VKENCVKKLAFVFSLVAVSAFAEDIKGTISDAKCGKAHADASEKSMKCVNGCVKGGQKAVLVTEDGKILQIADQEKVAAHLGHKVTVSGKVTGDSVAIDKVAMQ
jgi:hypothetical protein